MLQSDRALARDRFGRLVHGPQPLVNGLRRSKPKHLQLVFKKFPEFYGPKELTLEFSLSKSSSHYCQSGRRELEQLDGPSRVVA